MDWRRNSPTRGEPPAAQNWLEGSVSQHLVSVGYIRDLSRTLNLSIHLIIGLEQLLVIADVTPLTLAAKARPRQRDR